MSISNTSKTFYINEGKDVHFPEKGLSEEGSQSYGSGGSLAVDVVTKTVCC